LDITEQFVAEKSKAQLLWQAGWEHAQSAAMYTLSGLPMDANPEHRDAMFRAYQTAVKLWERLCCREQRTENEVKAAAKRIGEMLQRDNETAKARRGLVQFNQFERLNGKRILATELDWMIDIYLCGPSAAMRPHPSIKAFDLAQWSPWEIIYVTGLRAIDAAVQAIGRDDTELGLCLIFDALREMHLCDDFAIGNERNTEYAGWVDAVFDRNRGAVAAKETIYQKLRKRLKADEPPDHARWRRFMERERFHIEARRVFMDLQAPLERTPGSVLPAEALEQRVKLAVDAAVKKDRAALAKAAARKRNERNQAMRQFVIERWRAEKASYEGNKSDFGRHYSRLLLQEHEFEVEATTIATRWLRGL
jgi:hypothetical protein